jgi:ParB-like chromosome segregation protein Spo0J
MNKRPPITLPLRSIFISPQFERKGSLGDMNLLKNVILSEGLKEPLHVRKIEDTHYQVIHGRRCFLAICALEQAGFGSRFSHIPCVLVEGSEEEDGLTLLACNSLHVPMSDQEIDERIRELAEKFNAETIARRSGLSEKRVHQALSPESGNLLQPPSDDQRFTIEEANFDVLRAALTRLNVDDQTRRTLDDILFHAQRYMNGTPVAERALLNMVKSIQGHGQKVAQEEELKAKAIARR